MIPLSSFRVVELTFPFPFISRALLLGSSPESFYNPLFDIAARCFFLRYSQLSVLHIFSLTLSILSQPLFYSEYLLTQNKFRAREELRVDTSANDRVDTTEQAGWNRWRLIQIRSPRGGDGVIPETAAGTTLGVGQSVAISRLAG